MTEEEKLDMIFENNETLKHYRAKARSDFAWFCVHVIGYEDLEEFHTKLAIPTWQKCIGDFPYATKDKRGRTTVAAPKQNRVLWMQPRSTFKSSLFTIAAILWFIARNQNVTIGLGSWKDTIAEGFLTEVKDHMERNVLYRRMFPEVVWDDPGKQASKWAKDQILVPRTMKRKERTVETFSVMKPPTSKHYDIIILDDAVDATNVTTPDMIQKVKDKVAYLISNLKKPTGPMYFVGTRYHFDDAYGDMEDSHTLIGKDFFVFKRPAILDDGSFLCPNILGEAQIAEARKQGDYIWSCQYLLTPVNPTDVVMQPDKVKYYNEVPKDLEIHIALDPKDKPNSGDPATVMVWGYDSENVRLYWLDGWRMKSPLLEQVERLATFSQQYGPKKVRIEGIRPSPESIEPLLIAEIKKRKIRIPYEFVKGYGRTLVGGTRKEKPRIPMTLGPQLDNGSIYFPKQMIRRDEAGKTIDLVKLALDEMVSYPFGKHDDIIDNFALILLGIESFAPKKRIRRDSQDDITRIAAAHRAYAAERGGLGYAPARGA